MRNSPIRNPSELDDEELVSMAAHGDTLAEETLVVRYTPVVYSFTRNFYRDGWERADFVQEGMFGLIKAVRTYREGEVPFRIFATSCIKNELYGALRRSLRAKHAPLSGYLTLSEPEGENALSELLVSDGVLDRVIGADEASRFIDALTRRLSPFEKKVFIAFSDGLKPSETAAALGKPLKSVENALSRIRRKATSLSAESQA